MRNRLRFGQISDNILSSRLPRDNGRNLRSLERTIQFVHVRLLTMASEYSSRILPVVRISFSLRAKDERVTAFWLGQTERRTENCNALEN